MSLEQALIAAIGSVTTALVWVAKLLWGKSEQCERDRNEMRKEINKMKGDHGLAVGTLKAYEKCPAESCPFRRATLVGLLVGSAVLFLFGACASS
jgi:hypothetical protein